MVSRKGLKILFANKPGWDSHADTGLSSIGYRDPKIQNVRKYQIKLPLELMLLKQEGFLWFIL